MIHREDEGEVAVLRMEHGKVQALDVELVEALERALDELEAGPARAVVLTGSGSSFSAGVDLFRVLDEGQPYVERFLDSLSAMLRRLFLFPRPVVAAVNGHAIAGGLVLVCACDLRVMARGNGRLGVPELLVGVPFPAIALEVMRFATPPEHLQDLVYRGRRADVDEALARGLVDDAVEPERLLGRALAAARELGALEPAAFGLAKRQLRLPALELVERHGPSLDDEVLHAWSAPATAAAIRRYLDATLRR